ncbi:MAG: glutathione S-transferase family protein [Pseudomonadota bacterium]|uniref:glutathione S-transferase family protein n=1 Tax=Phenylobacterium sp. TaxID=1871053 RepID=UPI0025D70D53|nr:glutathione S-transferase family protein [Phenylobacterium sp.]MBT9469821.1 glutathione S-transferase family protein [Phenylobacterium sp.]
MIELRSVPTANGQKVHIALEETGLPYSVSFVDLVAGEHKTAAFRALNPFAKAPALLDPDGPGGQPIALSESMAIVFYLAEKAGGDLLAKGAQARAEELMWAAAISSSVAMPFAMQFFATNLAPEPTPWLETMMTQGCRDALAVFDQRLAERPFVMGEQFGVVDCLLYPVVATSAKRLAGGLNGYANLQRYEADLADRPGVARGMAVSPSIQIEAS